MDAALKSVAELGKQIGPLAARLQTLSDDADRLVQSIDPEQIRAIVGNVQAMSAKGVSVIDRADKLLSDNSDSIHRRFTTPMSFRRPWPTTRPTLTRR